ncbi:MAG: patatin-like phospholipase family protein [Myxococcota bacterium]|jgi:NTE family protein|nr:patatin-like phospholipase family protein [Myxococcota bacterium]
MEIDFHAPIGLALGSGAARGWSHIGVIRALKEARIEPEIVCGASAGAVVGAFYAADELDAFEGFVRGLDRRQLMAYLDPTLRGGLLKARKIFDALAAHLPDRAIESLPKPFAAVTTDLTTGHEIWLREGSLLTALRASIAMPGLVIPEAIDGRWMLDGGLVNPVPVSLCRALGAGSVIAVDLNTTLLVKPRLPVTEEKPAPDPVAEIEESMVSEALLEEQSASEEAGEAEGGLLSSQTAARLLTSFQIAAADLLDQFGFDETAEPSGPPLPSIYEVISTSINIMQTRIGRSRMAGDPPELLITPRLEDFALLDFDRADQAIAVGRRAVAHALAAR